MSKPVVVFSSFWHVEKILESGYYLHRLDDNNVIKLVVELPMNYSVYSIALSNPKLDDKLTNIAALNILNKFHRLDFFCPTYNILKDYQTDKDWEIYRKRFIGILKERTDKIKAWVSSLKPDHVYFLCCWENTSKKAKCHRQIVYDVFRNSKSIKDSVISLYCDGGKIGEGLRNENYTEDGAIYQVSDELATLNNSLGMANLNRDIF